MGSFVGSSVKVIQDEPWETWEKVTIKKYGTGAKDAMHAELVRIAGMAGEIPEVVVQAAIVPVLVAGVKTWTFTKDGKQDGEPAPVNRHWMGKLDPDYADFIVDEIRNFNEGRTTAEQREFLRKLADSDNDEGDTAA